MTYVVARRGGRFEIRESLHTANGPRSRTLAGFDVLTDDILTAAARRAQRPFDVEAVIRSARRTGARVRAATSEASRARSFVTASKRMARALGKPPLDARADAGAALLELLGFADAVTVSQPPRPFEPLAFPVLARLAEHRRVAAGGRRR
ncbi:MAG TPA: hypothetical protein VFV03_09020 [Solirubrobacteraceae bacterium]|nr:hypothetical protein [Solirubrobacteraceae bacterium]